MRTLSVLSLLLLMLLVAACETSVPTTATPTVESGPTDVATTPDSYPAPEEEQPVGEQPEGYPAPETDTPDGEQPVGEQPEGYPAPETDTPAEGQPEGEQPEGYPAPGDEQSSTDQPEAYATPPGGEVTDSGASGANGCPYDYSIYFQPLLDAQPDVQQSLGCPTGPTNQIWAAWQPFEDGNQMLWLENYDAVIAMYNGQWHGYTDTYEEGEPETPEGAPSPPSAELQQPIRGFAKVWVGIADEMGFATDEEGGYFADVQPMERGWMIRSPLGPLLVLMDMQTPQSGSGPLMSWVRAGDGWAQQ